MPSITKLTLGTFCRELVLQLEPLPDLLKSWEMTDADYATLRKSEFFQHELTNAVQEVQAMGPDAGFIQRCKILAEESLGNMVGIMNDKITPPETKVKLFDTFTELGRLKPQKQSVNAQQAENGPRGTQVVFNFGVGMPGLPTTLEVKGEVLEAVETKPDPIPNA